MSIRYSYDNFTTKGHGVIEGPGRVHDDDKEALYTFYKKIPKGYERISTVDDISVITKRFAFVSKQTIKQIDTELDRRYVLLFRSGEYVKRNNVGKIEIYKQKKAIKKKRLVKNNSDKPGDTYKEKVDATYQHLLRLHNRANSKVRDRAE